jgi:hypothetical protein
MHAHRSGDGRHRGVPASFEAIRHDDEVFGVTRITEVRDRPATGGGEDDALGGGQPPRPWRAA